VLLGLRLKSRAPKISQGGVKRVVHIVEEKVFTALSDGAEQESCHWVQDTDASNHMSGCRVAFSSINDRTVGAIRFADD
jgi:hypothetical protein